MFAGCLLAVTAAAGTRVPISRRAVRTGLAGGALVCAPVVLSHLLELRPPHNTPGFWSWALVVTVVATAEEVSCAAACMTRWLSLRAPAGL